MERSKVGTKKRRPDGLSLPNQHNIKVFYKIWKKYNDIQLTKKWIKTIEKWKIVHPPQYASGVGMPEILVKL